MGSLPPDQRILELALQKHGDSSKQVWWSNYVKGAEFYGVEMSTTRSVALEWWESSAHADPIGEALSLCDHPITEVRLAGISILERVLIPAGTLRTPDLPRLRNATRGGAFDDWNTCDWFCVKVLHQLMNGAPSNAHEEMLSWSSDEGVWSKRAALVAFVNILPKAEPSSGFDGQFMDTAARVVQDPRRFCQTAIGWTMRELSRRQPLEVEAFLTAHVAMLSREAITNASRKLEGEARSTLLAVHKGL
jgi:3-methyladenine DNA glycosylase AlkD